MYYALYSVMAIMTAKAYYVEKIDPIKSLFITFMIGVISFFLSSIYVAKFVFNPNRWTDLLAEDKTINYEDKYPYEDIYDKNEKICEKNYVFAKTPDDIVVMKYNEKDEVFWYWADSNIEYKNLETVARKYIKTFNCKNIYIDRKTTLENDKKERARQEEITKKKIEEWKLFHSQCNPNSNLLDFLEQNIVTLPTPSNLPSIRERGYEYRVRFTFEVYLKMKWEEENRAKSHFTDGFLEDIFENDVDQVISFLLCPNFNPLLKEHITLIDLLSFESDYSFDSKWFTVDEFGKKHIYLNAKEFENPLKLRER